MSETIRVGIAGFGMSGKIFHAPFLNADAHYCIKKVYERSTQRAKEEYPDVQIVRSFEELLTDDIDLVVVSVPNALHVSCAKAAIEAGKHVVVEKPAAAAADEVLELSRLARARGVVYTAYQNRRFDSDFLAVKEVLEQGRLGQILDYCAHWDRFATGAPRAAWKRQGQENDVLYDLGVHLIDQAYCLFGMPRQVYADVRKLREQSGYSDDFHVVLYYDTLRAELCSGETVAWQGPRYVVHGSRASFVKYGMDVQEKALVSGARPPMDGWGREDAENFGVLYTPDGAQMTQETVPSPAGNYGHFYENLYDAIENGAPLCVPAEEAADVLRIVEAARLSSREKRTIAL